MNIDLGILANVVAKGSTSVFGCIRWGRLCTSREVVLGVFSSARKTVTNSIQFGTYVSKRMIKLEKGTFKS